MSLFLPIFFFIFSAWLGLIMHNLIDELSIQHGLSSGTRLMGNLHMPLMVYVLECIV